MKKKVLILIVFFSYFFVVGFTVGKLEPKEVYRVYISGKPIGLIESKEKLENYIDQEQQSIKRKYGVDMQATRLIDDTKHVNCPKEKADAIIEYRNKKKFETIEEIKEVSGIGDSLFEKIKDYITT